MNGYVVDILRFSLHDGPGIRTTVFLKGCPLNCIWCHNPESIDPFPQLSYNQDLCIGCGECVGLCPFGCHGMQDGKHSFDRTNCDKCFRCVEKCYKGALKKIGSQRSVEEVIGIIMKDRKFYVTSGGGMTISGGEPMLQHEFTGSLLRAAKREGLHTCIETCGFADFKRFEDILNHVDIFLFDYKETDSDRHEKWTSVHNELIIENLHKLDSRGAAIILRCPIIPGLNDREDHFEGICRIASKLENLKEINVMSYHPYGGIKACRVGTEPGYKESAASKETVAAWIERIQSHTDIVVKRG